MKRYLLFLWVLGFIGCQKEAPKTDTPNGLDANKANMLAAPAAPNANPLTGSWTGMFGPNKITIVVTTAQDGKLEGRSIVAGNNRPFTGTMTKTGTGYQFEGREPGSNPFDGVFKFALDPNNASQLSGTWEPYKRGLASKKYKLGRREFKYEAGVGDYPEASQRLLKEEDVNNQPPDVLRIMRNEIYARHGYNFKNKDMRAYFDGQTWYMPWNTDVRALLTATEQKNEKLIKRYEEYNADYYDDFGR